MLRDLPLSGVVVVELSDSASAPFAGRILAALGAEVWKVERPTGDSARGWGPSEWKGRQIPRKRCAVEGSGGLPRADVPKPRHVCRMIGTTRLRGPRPGDSEPAHQRL